MEEKTGKGDETKDDSTKDKEKDKKSSTAIKSKTADDSTTEIIEENTEKLYDDEDDEFSYKARHTPSKLEEEKEKLKII